MSISSALSTAGRTLADLAYRCSPIFLTGGIASSIAGSTLPIISLTESVGFVNSLLNGNITSNTDDFFAHFSVMPGGSLINNAIGQYPFANQTVAANAIIANPLNVSLLMICPMRGDGAIVTKMATLMALQASLYQHISEGGLFTIATPGYLYTDMVMTSMRDVSRDFERQPQSAWQLDFTRPLTQLTEAQQVQSTLMGKLTNGSKTGTSWASTGTGNPFSSVVGSIF